MLKKTIFCFLFLSPALIYAQKGITIAQYINKYKNDAVEDMRRTGVPAAITMAQAILESSCGNSPLAVNANNHFGIKCHAEWKGPAYKHDDDEKQERFRKYKSALESFDDHSKFLMTRKHYAFLFSIPKTDYKSWAYGLKKAGYATNPQYAQLLIKIIETNGLQELDGGAYIENRPQPAIVATVHDQKVPTIVKQVPIVLKPTVNKESFIENTPIEPPSRVININNLECIVARSTDTYLSIANEFNLPLGRLLHYNEVKAGTELEAGEYVYIEKKRKKALEANWHIVQPNESLWLIAQTYGVKLGKLCKINRLSKDEALSAGTELRLQ